MNAVLSVNEKRFVHFDVCFNDEAFSNADSSVLVKFSSEQKRVSVCELVFENRLMKESNLKIVMNDARTAKVS